MNILFVNIIVVCFLVGFIIGGDPACENVPKTKIDECCKIPKAIDDKIIKDVSTNVQAMEGTPTFKKCKMSEEIFKKLNLVVNNDIDCNAGSQFAENSMSDPEWKKVMKEAFDGCCIEAPKLAEKYQQLVQFPKDQCNILFDVIIDCVRLVSFATCPKSSWTDSQVCNDGKTFTHKCGNELEAMEKFMMNQYA
ncbi:CLUMA_CG014270, isoform A [Clunio marinus]|uniref:CLUMA_CG014270, isoform A n=1 Tax=Clunio marinus TaxID=568069 RepID=A0A1J1IR07_9DIPT|nr:CLUMA_CG014270, isoform A [Clunio marinus]